jgi:hypothetical protein
MACKPTSPESLAALRKLRTEAAARGDDCLSVLLSGVELYASVGHELELLELMKQHADEIRPSVEGTPTVEELWRLYRQESPGDEGSG